MLQLSWKLKLKGSFGKRGCKFESSLLTRKLLKTRRTNRKTAHCIYGMSMSSGIFANFHRCGSLVVHVIDCPYNLHDSVGTASLLFPPTTINSLLT